jgi:hypothetical protein
LGLEVVPWGRAEGVGGVKMLFPLPRKGTNDTATYIRPRFSTFLLPSYNSQWRHLALVLSRIACEFVRGFPPNLDVARFPSGDAVNFNRLGDGVLLEGLQLPPGLVGKLESVCLCMEDEFWPKHETRHDSLSPLSQPLGRYTP